MAELDLRDRNDLERAAREVSKFYWPDVAVFISECDPDKIDALLARGDSLEADLAALQENYDELESERDALLEQIDAFLKQQPED